MSEEHIKLVETIEKWQWVKEDIFEKRYDGLVNFVDVNKKLPSPSDNKSLW